MAKATAGDSGFSASSFEAALSHALERRVPTRWLAWRRRLLVLAGLLGGLGLFIGMGWLARTPFVDVGFTVEPDGTVLLRAHDAPALAAHGGKAVLALRNPLGQQRVATASVLNRSPRWLVDDATRSEVVANERWLADALRQGGVTLLLADGSSVELKATPRGFAKLGWTLWPIAALALVLWLVGTALLLLRWRARNLLYLTMALAQGMNLLAGGMQSMPGLGLPAGLAELDFPWRATLDLATAAAVLHATALHPVRLPSASRFGLLAWLPAMALSVWVWQSPPAATWWWVQALVLALSSGALGVLSLAYLRERNPFVVLMRRFGFAAIGSLLLLCALAVAAQTLQALPVGTVHAGAQMWTVFFAALLLLLPFLSRSRQAMREFALLAGVSTVATSLDLLFAAVFSFGQFTSLALAVFLALAVYAAARQWIVNQMTGSRVLTLERTFERLYKVARELEADPSRHAALLTQLLRDLFEPLEVLRVARSSPHSRLLGDGSSLIVPLSRDDSHSTQSLVLRFAQRGRRIFTLEDARLTDRIVEQLRRAVAYDKAVERGRSEERARLAQDLHDDIGARLLTLMYQAQTPEMEAYVRHTLQDLKTLTRGLAASEHRLSHACAEWKSDLTQRLAAAQVDLRWSMQWDRDIRLSMVQWSALTRVLRELATNILAHAQASQVEVHGVWRGGALSLRVSDDGIGRRPEAWSHGLGLGGVRKRVKQLGGTVHWEEAVPRGIACHVALPPLPSGSDRPPGRQPD
jgi:signal transduction histidine kinase